MSRALTHGSLFAGIGGFDLGFERAGMKSVWQVEIDPFCRKVLEKHFPHAERFHDVRQVGAGNLVRVDVISGGFPCQDISSAGRRAGIAEGTRSGLWFEYRRIIGELRPKVVVVENVAALLERGMGRVIGDLADLGYDAEWATVPACLFRAPHCRERVWIVAYPQSDGFQGRLLQDEAQGFLPEVSLTRNWTSGPFSHWKEFLAEPSLCGMADGFPNRVAELTALGNAIVPQIAEWIGRRIVEASNQVS
jgi:DNA (cytosine-5)-methyltransferase 1